MISHRRTLALLLAASVLLGAGCAARTWNHLKFEPHDEGRFVLVTDEGYLGRAYFDTDLFREIEILRQRADRNPAEPAVWKTEIFILRKIDVHRTDKEGKDKHYIATLSPDEEAALLRVAKLFVDWVWAYSGGHCRLDADIEVIDKPLTRLEGSDDLMYPWSSVIDDVIAGKVEKRKTDSVIVLWPKGNVPVGNLGGLTQSFGYWGAGYAWIVMRQFVTKTGKKLKPNEPFYAEVVLHEWLHQVEFVRGMRMDYRGLPTLHMAQAMGYPESYKFGVVHPGWMLSYRDFMSVYMTPGIWRASTIAYKGPIRHGPDFDGGWLPEWLIAGPFPNDKTGLDRDFIGEANVLPAENQAAGAKDAAANKEQTLWKKTTTKELVNFDSLFKPNDNVVAYAHVYVHSPADREAKIWAGSDDGLAMWVNGMPVWKNRVSRGVTPDEDRVLIYLKAGWNRLLCKVDEGAGGWGLQVRLSDPDGKPLEDIRFQADRPKDPATIVGNVTPADIPKPSWKPKFFQWRDVRDDPWRLLPELRQRELRLITGDPDLGITTGNGVTTVVPGPGRRPAAFLAAKEPGGRRVDNAMDFRPDKLESLAWLRFKRDGAERDLVLLRPDLVDFWFERLDAADDPSERIIGRIADANRPLIAVETRLNWTDADGPPPTELHLVRSSDAHVAVNLLPDHATAAPGAKVKCRVRVTNHGVAPVTLTRTKITSTLPLWKVWRVSDSAETKLAPGETQVRELTVRLPSGRPRPVPLWAEVEYTVGERDAKVSDLAVVYIPPPPKPAEPAKTAEPPTKGK